MNRTYILFALTIVLMAAGREANADEDLADAAREFHVRAIERAGIILPMYVSPARIHTNEPYNRLMELKRKYVSVPIWVILNPASGSGTEENANYTKAIDRLKGAGCVVLGYVATGYSKRPASSVQAEVRRWRELYPEVQGIFFDEMVHEDTSDGVEHQAGLTDFAHREGFWPIVGNPGTGTPGRYFKAKAADVIVIHESSQWPSEKTLHGNYFGGYADFPPHTRSVMLHSTPALDPEKLRMARKYARWFYVTESPYHPDDPEALNPWGTLSTLMPQLCEQLSRD